jgi:hypothetical protein
MKVTTLNNLSEILALMKTVFGTEATAKKHREALDSNILNVNYAIFSDDVTVSILGTGCLGSMILGKQE